MMFFCMAVLDRPSFVARLSGYSILFIGSQYFVINPFKRITAICGINGWAYDILMVLLTAIYVVTLPRAYDALKTVIPFIKCFNGEYDFKNTKRY